MAVLECVKLGAKFGQVILLVDLTVAGDAQLVLAQIAALGHEPEIRHIAYAAGVHVVAVIFDEQHDAPVADDYLIDKWMALRDVVDPRAVHLWRGQATAPTC